MSCTALLAVALLAPWWDDYPYTTQSHDVATVLQVGGNSALTGGVDDPTWGIEAARVRARWLAPLVEPLRPRQIRILTWVETFGTTHSYVAAFEPKPGGGLVGHESDPDLAKPGLNHWSWQLFKPSDDTVVRWLGLESYFDDEPVARPWTRTHPRYGCPPRTYPDGTLATGSSDPERPDTARIFDAGGSKNIQGDLDIDYGFNAKVAEAGVTAHLIPVPGRDGVRYSGQFSVGKDAACPVWIDYAKASARQLADFGVEGLWADNFSAWDSLGSTPVDRAFGDWSVAGFSGYLRTQGVTLGDDPNVSIRTYLRQKLRALGGDDTNLRDPHWRDEAWLADPIWRRYLCYKQGVGQAALQRFHDVFHAAAREAGIEDFGIQGNDIPIYSLGMPRPSSLEMVSTEFGPGWNLFCGPRGLGLPPDGRIAPVIRTARVHAKSRFVQVWYYLDAGYEDRRGDDALFKRVAYEMLANNATIQCHPGNPRVAGSVAAHAEVSAFVNQQRQLWGDRVPWAKIAVVYSADSQLAELTPGGMVHFDAQRHVFDLLGWGTWLAERHLPYDVVAEWDLTSEKLAGYRTLLLPTVTAMGAEVCSQVLRPWIEAGGTLILSGPCGEGHDVDGMLERPDEPRAAFESSAVGRHRPRRQHAAELDRQVGRGGCSSALARIRLLSAQARRGATRRLGRRPRVVLAGRLVRRRPATHDQACHVSPARSMLFVELAKLADEPVEPLTIALRAPGQSALTAELQRPGREPVTVRWRSEAAR